MASVRPSSRSASAPSVDRSSSCSPRLTRSRPTSRHVLGSLGENSSHIAPRRHTLALPGTSFELTVRESSRTSQVHSEPMDILQAGYSSKYSDLFCEREEAVCQVGRLQEKSYRLEADNQALQTHNSELQRRLESANSELLKLRQEVIQSERTMSAVKTSLASAFDMLHRPCAARSSSPSASAAPISPSSVSRSNSVFTSPRLFSSPLSPLMARNPLLLRSGSLGAPKPLPTLTGAMSPLIRQAQSNTDSSPLSPMNSPTSAVTPSGRLTVLPSLLPPPMNESLPMSPRLLLTHRTTRPLLPISPYRADNHHGLTSRQRNASEPSLLTPVPEPSKIARESMPGLDVGSYSTGALAGSASLNVSSQLYDSPSLGREYSRRNLHLSPLSVEVCPSPIRSDVRSTRPTPHTMSWKGPSSVHELRVLQPFYPSASQTARRTHPAKPRQQAVSSYAQSKLNSPSVTSPRSSPTHRHTISSAAKRVSVPGSTTSSRSLNSEVTLRRKEQKGDRASTANSAYTVDGSRDLTRLAEEFNEKVKGCLNEAQLLTYHSLLRAFHNDEMPLAGPSGLLHQFSLLVENTWIRMDERSANHERHTLMADFEALLKADMKGR